MSPIRPLLATPLEIQDIRRVGHAAWEATYRSILSDAQFDYMFGRMYSAEALNAQMEHCAFLGYFNQNTLLGFMSVEWPKAELAFVKVHKLYVHPEAQGQGVGRALLDHLAQLCPAHQVREIRLNVNRFNPAQHFYQKLGFAILYEEDIDIGQGYLMEDYVMGRLLMAPSEPTAP